MREGWILGILLMGSAFVYAEQQTATPDAQPTEEALIADDTPNMYDRQQIRQANVQSRQLRGKWKLLL